MLSWMLLGPLRSKTPGVPWPAMELQCSEFLIAITVEVLEEIGFTAEEARTVVPRKGAGCEKCNDTGYKGRIGLYEVMQVTDTLREMILVGASTLELRRAAIEHGMLTLRASGLRKIAAGRTSVEEVLKETVQ